MKIEPSPKFKKSYKKRIKNYPKLASQTAKRIKMFQMNPKNPVLRTHPLLGSKDDLFAFSVNGDIRIIYRLIEDDYAQFIDIGSHNQVY